MSEVEMLALLKSINIKVEALQAQMIMFQEALQPDLEYPTKPKIIVTEEITKKGKYIWHQVAGGGKVRKCNNEPCPYYLKYSEELETYQHGKYDANTKVWSFISNMCEFYGEGK